MAAGEANSLLRHLRRLAGTAEAQGASDRALIESFVSDRDDAAFATLFRRHGPMVLSLCRRVLRNEEEADDAFQATFLVLARKAHSLRSRDTVSSWLYGVAYRTALKARCSAARRRAREAAAPARVAADPLTELTVAEAQGIVDRELASLPEKYRAPLLLCCLQGLARDEAARQLGWTLGLLKSRLEQARELLRDRLSRRGLALPAALLSVGTLGTTLQAAVPAALAEATVKAAARVAAGAAATPLVSSQVISLAEGVVRAMLWTKVKVALALALTLAAVGVGISGVMQLRAGASPDAPAPGAFRVLAPAPEPAPPAVPGPAGKPLPLEAKALERWGWAEVVFTGRLGKVVPGAVAQSEPPIYYHTLQFQVGKVLRGSLKKGEEIAAGHSIKQRARPVFPEGKECLVALSSSRGRLVVRAVQEVTPAELAQAELACSVPVGWSVDKGRLLSPWAKLGAKAWPAAAKGKGPLVCAETGRPALLVGEGVELTAEPVPPPVKLKYGNPDGDGEYRVTVKNTTDKRVTVPALLSDGKAPLWEESLVLLCQGKAYAVPGAKGVGKVARPTVLGPGEAVSGVVNVFKLQGPEWPKGGYRIEFQFCLGEKSVTKSFYYLSKHHDPLRQKALAGK
jgi:RNA polymerase sigma factor (sigma-70 family)